MPFYASEGCFWPLTASMTSDVKNNHAYVITQDSCNKFIEFTDLTNVIKLLAKQMPLLHLKFKSFYGI